jgi:hypothetical protein
MKNLIAIFLVYLTPLTMAVAQTCSKQSPTHTVALLELYTSEGCSSCPPADKAVSALRQGAKQDLVVPLSLHVDYWDYIGWTDRFAKPEFTSRQRLLAEAMNSRAVYTPEIFLGGAEFRNWSGNLDDRIGLVNRQPARADIGIELMQAAGGRLPVTVNTKSAQGGSLYIALYENGLSSNVKAGENSGVLLRHDFVVRDWIGPFAVPADAPGRKMAFRQSIPIPAASSPAELGVAAFIQDARGQVLQALALPLCGS